MIESPKSVRGAALAVCVALLSACATAPVFTGRTVMGDELKDEVLRMAVPYAKMGAKCQAPVDSIRAEVVDRSPDGSWNDKGQMTSGEVTEHWTVFLCNTQKVLVVKLRALPDGTTRYSLLYKQ